MSTTNLILQQLPRFPAHVSATNGLTAVVDGGVDLVIKPDYGSLVPVPAVTNPSATYFMAWDRDIDYYQSISFQDFADNLAEQVLVGPLLAISALTMAADQAIYFSDANTAHAYSLSAFVRGISGSADAAAFRTAIGLGSAALSSLSALTLTAGDLLYAGSSNALLRLAVGSTGQVLTVSGGNPAWADLGVTLHAATAKTALADADEFAISDSAASNVLKRVTLTNLISSIFKTARKIANAYFDTSFRLWDATDLTKGLSFVLSGITTATTRSITMPDANVDLTRVNNLLGYDQTWQDVTASRVAGTTYQNTTGRPIQIYLYSRSSSATPQNFQVSSDNFVSDIKSVGYLPDSGVAPTTTQIIIPVGQYYRASAVAASLTIVRWWELR